MKLKVRLFDNNNNSRKGMWKKFKVEYNKTTKNTLLTAPKELFFTATKPASNKFKNLRELSLMAKEFFTIFMESKGKFNKLKVTAFFRAYDM